MSAVMEPPELSMDAKQKIEDITLAAMSNIVALTSNAIQGIIVQAASRVAEEIRDAEIKQE